MKSWPKLLVVVVVVAALAASAQASIVVNGSFEDAAMGYSVPPDGGFTTLYGGSTAIDGWQVIDGSVDWINGYWQAADGTKSLDLAGLSDGGVLANTVTTVVGQEYTLTFAMAGNPDDNGDALQRTKQMLVTVDDVAAEVFTFDTTNRTRSDMGWTWHSIAFVADSESTILKFENIPGLNPAYYGAALDAVSIDPVPEPATLLVWSILGAASWLGMRVWRGGQRICRRAWAAENRQAILEIVSRRESR